MLTDARFAELLTHPYEQRGLEFKPPGPRTDQYLFAQVTRAALGMANIATGGFVVIGVEERVGDFLPVGCSPADLASWRYDPVAALIAEYADPWLDFDLHQKDFEGKQFVVLEVREFEEFPVLCKKEYQAPPSQRHPGGSRTPPPPLLRRGACYVRSRRKPETSEIPGLVEMREVLDLAIDKGVKRFVDRARAAGLDLAGVPVRPLIEEQFIRQIGDTEGG